VTATCRVENELEPKGGIIIIHLGKGLPKACARGWVCLERMGVSRFIRGYVEKRRSIEKKKKLCYAKREASYKRATERGKRGLGNRW